MKPQRPEDWPPANPAVTRQVWAILTEAARSRCRTPSVRELAHHLTCTPSLTRRALNALRAAGYIDWLPGATGAISVLIPFVVEPVRVAGEMPVQEIVP